jgi:surfactin synthase thioesterase subunit
VNVQPIRLPGRESRIAEPGLDRFDAVVAPVVACLEQSVRPPYVLVGYCLGALVMFEVARAIEARPTRAGPAELWVVSSPAPARYVHEPVPPDAVWELVSSFTGVDFSDDGDTRIRALKDLTKATIDADLGLQASYRYESGRPLAAPIRAYWSKRSDVLDREDVLCWNAETDAAFHLVAHDGDDLLPKGPPHALFDDVGRLVAGRS